MNANLRDYRQSTALEAADRHWLDALIIRRVLMDDFPGALEPCEGDVRVAVELGT